MKKALIIIGLLFCQAFAVSPFTWFWNISLTGDTATVVKWKANNDSVLNFSKRVTDTVNILPRLAATANVFSGAVTFDSLKVHGTVIRKDGNVGIGTANPRDVLAVRGGGTASTVEIGGVGTQCYIRSIDRDDALYRSLEFRTKSETASMTILANGNVGIGTTSPSDLLTVDPGDGGLTGITLSDSHNQNLGFSINTLNAGVIFGADITAQGYATTYGELRFFRTLGNKSTPLESMRIDSSGNVAIGTTDPAGNRLYVSGNAGGTSSWSSSSDRRFKSNITPLDSSLTKVSKLQGVTYTWNRAAFPKKNFPEGKQIGLIAQEVEKVYPELVNTDAEGYKSLSYDKLTAVLIEAVKEQQKTIDQLTKRVDELEKKK